MKTPDPMEILSMFQGVATLTPIPDARQGNPVMLPVKNGARIAKEDFYGRAEAYRKSATRETVAMS
jgi:hypothetical protein